MKVKFKKLDERAVIPKYATPYSSGFDLYTIEEVHLAPNVPKLIRTGFAIELPENTEFQIRPRSGIALKDGISIFNAPATIDEDYRGEVLILAYWNGQTIKNFTTCYDKYSDPFCCGESCVRTHIVVPAGTRIAQGVICPVIRVEIEEAEELSNTERDSKGFGSTGIN